jgi:hypothetical protein
MLVTNDVNGGRGLFNISEWGLHENEAGEAAEIFQEGKMPPAAF